MINQAYRGFKLRGRRSITNDLTFNEIARERDSTHCSVALSLCTDLKMHMIHDFLFQTEE